MFGFAAALAGGRRVPGCRGGGPYAEARGGLTRGPRPGGRFTQVVQCPPNFGLARGQFYNLFAKREPGLSQKNLFPALFFVVFYLPPPPSDWPSLGQPWTPKYWESNTFPHQWFVTKCSYITHEIWFMDDLLDLPSTNNFSSIFGICGVQGCLIFHF